MSIFSNVESAPTPERNQLRSDFKADTHPQKVNLIRGAYETDEGHPWILPVVKKAEHKLADHIEAESINHEYMPVLGLDSFVTNATKMLLGPDSKAVQEGRAFGIQSISGTGALRIGGDFLVKQLGRKICYVSDPTWDNHNLIFKDSGFEEIRKYRVWHKDSKSMDFHGTVSYTHLTLPTTPYV